MSGPSGGMGVPDAAAMMAALEAVHDPHVPVSLRRMGMLRQVRCDADGTARVEICIPCMACPGAALLREGIRQALLAVDGVRDVVVEEGWHLPWSRDMVEPDVRDLMRRNGIQL
ncbi:metal-sulfur cluster assembly factor [Azospirillum sp. ST 5-10]|uniref:metal-sulfur cluster assembly factor n=1 Tax=unclassified Azospirillum TaxID=2630922 RepID=UPI003F4A648B